MKNEENDYDMDNLKANRYYKAVFKSSEYYKKSKSIVKDYGAFVQSIDNNSNSNEDIKKTHTIEKDEKEKKV